MKNLILLLICLTTVNYVLSLDCYVTDLEALKQGNLQPKVQNCKDNIRQVLEMQGQSVPSLPDDDALACYQVNIVSDAMSIAVKGCVPEGGCEPMKTIFRTMFDLDPNTPIKQVTCYECGFNRCNAGTPGSGSSIFHSINFVVALAFAAFAFIM